MGAEIITVVGAVGAAVVGALLTLVVQRRLNREDRQAEYDALMAQYRGPLLHAAYDLQSRLWNILCKRFVQQFWPEGERQRQYIVDNTLFVIAQYFCWIEIIRREVQLLDIGDHTLELSRLRDEIYRLWQTSDIEDPAFMVWAGEQRGIGESVLRETDRGPDCMGYAAFARALAESNSLAMLDLSRDIERLAVDPDHGRERLTAIQHALTEMLDKLDPDHEYFPPDRRGPADCPPAAADSDDQPR